MTDVLVGVVSSAAAPPPLRLSFPAGLSVKTDGTRAEQRRPETWPPTSDIRAGWWNPVMTQTLALFYSVFTLFDWWNADDFSLPACASPASRTCWCWCCSWWWWWWSHSEDSEVRNDKLHHISQFYFTFRFLWIRFISTEINRSTKKSHEPRFEVI